MFVLLSVVVQVIDQDDIPTFELEDHPPVAAHVHRPEAGGIPLQLVQPESGEVHVPRFGRHAEPRQDEPQTVGMFRLDSGLGACLEVRAQPLVPEGFNHGYTIDCNPMGCKPLL